MNYDRLEQMRRALCWSTRWCCRTSTSRSMRILLNRVGRAQAVAVLVLTLSGCGPDGLFSSHAPPPVVAKSTVKVADDYIIGSGDSLSIFVYRNPDLSEAAVAVRPDGRISTPLIEDIVAAGKTPTHSRAKSSSGWVNSSRSPTSP